MTKKKEIARPPIVNELQRMRRRVNKKARAAKPPKKRKLMIELRLRAPTMALVRSRPSDRMLEEAWWFVLLAPNGKVLATSEVYSKKANAKRAAYALLKQLRSLKFGDLDVELREFADQ